MICYFLPQKNHCEKICLIGMDPFDVSFKLPLLYSFHKMISDKYMKGRLFWSVTSFPKQIIVKLSPYIRKYYKEVLLICFFLPQTDQCDKIRNGSLWCIFLIAFALFYTLKDFHQIYESGALLICIKMNLEKSSKRRLLGEERKGNPPHRIRS